ncbi:MAG: D-glycerate dehydrogenase [Candidatus Paceibacterota bacterium]
MKKIYVTRVIPESGINLLLSKGYEVDINPKDRILSKRELVKQLKKKPYDAVLSLLTDTIDKDIFDAVPSVKLFSNYAVGFNNIDVKEADKREIVVTNTPGASSDAVAEHTVALLMAVSCRIVEADRFTRKGKYQGWDPMLFLGQDLSGKKIGILGAGKIGFQVAHILARGFNMKVGYYDIKRNEDFERDYEAVFHPTPEELLSSSDVVSIHVPLLDSTRHLINKERLSLMKKTAYLVNTSRGPVIDEDALVWALKNKVICGAGIDVFEKEPKLAKGLNKLQNVVLTPHIASSTIKTRNDMSILAASNIIDFFEGKELKNKVIV